MATSEELSDFQTRLFEFLASIESLDSFFQRLLQETTQLAGGRFAVLARAEKGRWLVLAQAGSDEALPVELMSDALDANERVADRGWLCVPVGTKEQPGEMLVVKTPHAVSVAEHFAPLRPSLSAALATARLQRQQRTRSQRLQAMLDIFKGWSQQRELQDLLEEMAATSIRLLDAERASIFLWDEASKTLVGRPAIGIEGGELRIPDDAGVVGDVFRNGVAKRVDADLSSEQAEIDRRVDEQSGFATHSLICVPLVGPDDKSLGAFEVLNKRGGKFDDADEETLCELARYASVTLENAQQFTHLAQAGQCMADEAAGGVRMIGESPLMDALKSTVQRVARTDLSVLILGENGTGKEVVSQMVHYGSERRNEPLVTVNCAALTETLLESELFGHEKGAFTDAHQTRAGKFELASGGTLFLDEIGDMSLSGQAKLLRALEEKVIVRVGGSTPIPTNTRVLAATNQDLTELVRERQFREDLFYRLNVVTIDLPPLRDRGEDVVLLAEFFLEDFALKARRQPPQLTADAKKRLIGHGWPGNVRELRNLMERLAFLSTGDQVDAGELEFIMSPRDDMQFPSLSHKLPEATRQFQIAYIKKQIEQARGNMTAAAERLGLHRSNLYRKMKQLGMSAQEESD